jgi:hypothetical protein
MKGGVAMILGVKDWIDLAALVTAPMALVHGSKDARTAA